MKGNFVNLCLKEKTMLKEQRRISHIEKNEVTLSIKE